MIMIFRLAGLRENPKPAINDEDGTLRFKKKFIRSDRRTNELTKLEYDVSLEKDSYIILDDLSLGITGISCSSKWLNISLPLNLEVPTLLADSKSNPILVHASTSWGCRNKYGSTSTIFKRVKGMLSKSATSDTQEIAFAAEDYSPLGFFGNSTVSFFTNHSLINTGDLKRMVSSMGGQSSNIDWKKSARENLRGQWPDTGNDMGYGSKFGLFNWNYDSSTDAAVENSMMVGNCN
jgi:hypothetical protein